MRKVFLMRDRYSEHAVEGSIVIEGDLIEGTAQRVKHVFYTLERPWLDNEKDVSCIPVGEYPCEIWESPSKGLRYRLSDTEPRTFILIHIGNYPDDIEGCILLGMSRGQYEGKPAVWKSAKAIAAFEKVMASKPFLLVIQDA